MMVGHGSMGDMSTWMGAIGLIWILVAVALLVLIVIATVWLALRLRVTVEGSAG